LDSPLLWDSFPNAAWAALVGGPVGFTLIYWSMSTLGRSRLDRTQFLAPGLHQPAFVVLILASVSVGAATTLSRSLGWFSLLLVVPGALLASAYSLWLLRFGLQSFRTKEWTLAPDGTIRTPAGETISPMYADLHVYWSSNLVVWETGLVQVTDKEGKKWTNNYPNLRAAKSAHATLRDGCGLPTTPGK
jgi:hypothetical protein